MFLILITRNRLNVTKNIVKNEPTTSYPATPPLHPSLPRTRTNRHIKIFLSFDRNRFTSLNRNFVLWNFCLSDAPVSIIRLSRFGSFNVQRSLSLSDQFLRRSNKKLGPVIGIHTDVRTKQYFPAFTLSTLWRDFWIFVFANQSRQRSEYLAVQRIS